MSVGKERKTWRGQSRRASGTQGKGWVASIPAGNLDGAERLHCGVRLRVVLKKTPRAAVGVCCWGAGRPSEADKPGIDLYHAGEEQTKQEVVGSDAQGFSENKEAAVKGGRAAGKALNAFEGETSKKVVTTKNFKQQIAERKRQKKQQAKLEKPDDE